MGSRTGGAIAPLVIIPLQMAFGWRASFFSFGFLGVLWAIVWYSWFRDHPAEKAGVSREEIAEIDAPPSGKRPTLPWGLLIRTRNLQYITAMYLTYGYCTFFFVSWLPTYLVKGRGFSEQGLLLATLPFLMGAIASYCGGFTSDALVRRIGLKWGRRAVGVAGLGSSSLFTILAILTAHPYVSLVFLALSHAGSDLMLPVAWAVCLDIGRKHTGVVTSIMNTAGGIGGFFSGVFFGYIVQYAMVKLPALGLPLRSGPRNFAYDVPLVPLIVVLSISASLWLKIDSTQQISPEKVTSA